MLVDQSNEEQGAPHEDVVTLRSTSCGQWMGHTHRTPAW